MPVGRRTSGIDSPAARIRGLRKAYGAHLVFDGLDLDVARGERVAVLGASGCGKSTLLRCIAGLERSDGGTIVTAGEIGVMFQEPRLFPWLDVARNVEIETVEDEMRAVRLAQPANPRRRRIDPRRPPSDRHQTGTVSVQPTSHFSSRRIPFSESFPQAANNKIATRISSVREVC